MEQPPTPLPAHVCKLSLAEEAKTDKSPGQGSGSVDDGPLMDPLGGQVLVPEQGS